MSAKCPKCSSASADSDNYCGVCGHQLAKSRSPLLGTRVDMQLSDIRYNLSQVYLKKGDYQKALEIFEKILQDKPDDPEVQNKISEIKSMLDVSEKPPVMK